MSQLAAAWGEVQRLRDRVEELEGLIGMPPMQPPLPGFTRREMQLLGVLLKNPIMRREFAFSLIWGGDSDINEKILDVFICKLRRKLRSYDVSIGCKWGIGYFISPEDKAKVRQVLAATAEVA